MKLKLTNYQIDAVADTVFALTDAAERYEKHHKLTAVSLSAPTGAGKTVIAAAVFERLWFGDEDTEPNPNLTVLWVTDAPSLNEQTRRKIQVATDMIVPSQVVSVTADFDQETFDPGRLYFVHIQQLGKGATRYNHKIDGKRVWPLWDTISNTVSTRPQDFLLVIDEAHRGTSPKKNGGGKTIAAQLIDGAGGKLPPAPVVLGISATPERFTDAMTKNDRILDPIRVNRQAVRASGLLKDKIRIRHPKKTETQLGDSTLLERAVKDLRDYDTYWSTYAKENPQEPVVRPALVVQVQAKASDAQLTMILDTLIGAWDVLAGKAIAHTFEEHSTLAVGTRSVRYIAPQDIQDDSYARVVLCKEALTTGWDCPRAEVMLSFRKAQDTTYVAQLIGRMVRTPLARRITTNDVLNTVGLFLPYFEEATVEKVKAELEADESGLPPIELDSVICTRNKSVPDKIWKRIQALPTYTRPTKNHRNEVARLNGLAVLLAGAGLRPDATDSSRAFLIGSLDNEATRLGASLDQKAAALADFEYAVQEVDLTTGTSAESTEHVFLNARNIDDTFRRARRLLGDAAAKWYWETLCDRDEMDPDDAKLRVAILAQDPTVVTALEKAAGSLIDAWRDEHNSAINDLPDGQRAAFYDIWEQARAPQKLSVVLPATITAPGNEKRWKHHIFVNGGHTFPAKINGWEEEVLEAELAKKSLKAWYRNPTAGHRAIGVPYTEGGTPRTLYPDFLFVHETEDGELALDLIDPHRPDASDTGPKWAGLADYASKHGDYFRKIIGVIKDGGTLKSLDLSNPNVRTLLPAATNEPAIRKLFASHGGTY